jgi:hypothetical protein
LAMHYVCSVQSESCQSLASVHLGCYVQHRFHWHYWDLQPRF